MLLNTNQYSEPSSLPTDYALVSRYQQARQTKSSDDLHAAQQSNEYDADDDDDDSIYDDPSETTSSQYASVGTQPKTRRFTLPTQNNTRPLLSPLPESDYPGSNNPAFPHERTPLLIQVPRIEETPPSYGNTDPTLWTEFVILFRYTIPVLGYVEELRIFINHAEQTFPIDRIYWNTVSSLLP